MVSLSTICSNYNNLTDKNTTHSYVSSVYDKLFENIQYDVKNILEIGIDRGGSIKLWSDYFVNANIYGADTNINNAQWTSSERIKLIQGNAYDRSFLERIPSEFDIIVDDGPHTLDSMIFCLKNYQYKLTDNGILIIEDIQDISWIDTLKNYVDPNLINCATSVDLRSIKGRYDDILYIIDKRKLKE